MGKYLSLVKSLFGGAPSLFLLLGVYVGGFVGMVVLGCGSGKQVLGVRAAKTTTERVREFGVLIFLFDFTYKNRESKVHE